MYILKKVCFYLSKQSFPEVKVLLTGKGDPKKVMQRFYERVKITILLKSREVKVKSF